jgi:membrane associated rhomboid family serine protease
MSFIDELKHSFKGNNNFKILIYINLIIFVCIIVVNAVTYLFGYDNFDIVSWLALPANFNVLIRKPWTIVTYMFTQSGFLHILFNLLIFYWFGRLFLQYLSQRQLLGVYLLGGFMGALFYILAYNTLPVFADAKPAAIVIGASASVMAIVISIAALVPNQKIYMLFFGQVKLLYIAIIVVLLDIISIPVGNPGGHIAHLGGAFMGYFFVIQYRKGKDITVPVTRLLNTVKVFFAPSPKIKIKSAGNKKKTQHKRPETDMEYNARKKAEQDEIDSILEKIAKSGYSSLTTDEKDKLFKMSNKR